MPQYLDPEQIFPKRLGLMNGNTLVLEYYHLGKDKFKKHIIPYDVSKDPKTNVEEIFKNSKHAPYLKRVNPKNVRLVLEGNKIQVKKDANTRNYDQFLEGPKFEDYVPPSTYQIQKQHQRQPVPHKEYQPERPPPQASVKSIEEPKPQPPPPAPAEPEDYYEQQFQDFEVSASMEKPSNISSSFSKVDPPFSEKTSSLSKISEPQPAKKQKEAPVIEEVIEELEENFDFLDEDDGKKKKKDKKKSKSKDKKSKKDKGQKKAEKKKQTVQNNTVEDEFQFL